MNLVSGTEAAVIIDLGLLVFREGANKGNYISLTSRGIVQGPDPKIAHALAILPGKCSCICVQSSVTSSVGVLALHCNDRVRVTDMAAAAAAAAAAAEVQNLLRFLSQDAKVPLATALPKVGELRKANLNR
jgi:hypothetical protein